MLTHPETQAPDVEFESWCNRIVDTLRAIDEGSSE